MKMKITRVCKNPVKFISGWPGLFAGLEVLNQVRPVVLEADPGPSGPVNERYRNSGLLAGFRVAKKKSKKSFFQKKFLKIFFSNFFGMILAIIVAMKINCCYHNQHVCIEGIVLSVYISFIANRATLRATDLI